MGKSFASCTCDKDLRSKISKLLKHAHSKEANNMTLKFDKEAEQTFLSKRQTNDQQLDMLNIINHEGKAN